MNRASAAVLVDLLGETRARIVGLLRDAPAPVADLARTLELSEVAVRRHLQVLERDGFVAAEIVRREGPGRPSAHYVLTAKARRLYPDQSAEFASELLEYVEQRHGRSELLGFLRWRTDRHADRYELAMADAEQPRERAGLLAVLLSQDGFAADVTLDGDDHLQLTQRHCAVSDLAREHPEICAWEAAMFQRLLGTRISRRQTIAGGAPACVCNVRAPAGLPRAQAT